MRKGKLIAGILWLIVGALLILGLASVLQRLLIAGTTLMNELGGMAVYDDADAEMTPEATDFLTEDDFDDPEPVVTMEPEELFSIPVEETAEELARENEEK